MSTNPGFTEASRERLAAYARLLRRWAPKLDLIAPGDLDRLEERHIEDSLRALGVVQTAPDGPCVDVGSGAGLPGIPLCIASNRFWRLVEPRKRRAAFLEEVVRELALDAEVVTERAEALAADLHGAHAVATARALAEPAQAVALCRPLLRPGGRTILWLGKGAELPPFAEEVGEGLVSIELRDP